MRVPVKNIIGKENSGFSCQLQAQLMYSGMLRLVMGWVSGSHSFSCLFFFCLISVSAAIMSNFNHERFVFAAMSNRYARVCMEEAIRYARTRKTFGKPLIQHQVIRHKVSSAASTITCAAMIDI